MPTTKSGPTSPESPERKTFILEWFATHPVVGLIGSIASVLGVLFAGWSYLSTLRTRELTFYVNPAKTTIVKSGQSSDLHVLYKGQSHCCPVRSPIDSTGCRGRVSRCRSRRPEVPVKWAFSRRA